MDGLANLDILPLNSICLKDDWKYLYSLSMMVHGALDDPSNEVFVEDEYLNYLICTF